MEKVMVTKSTEGLPKEGETMKQTEKNVEFAKGGKTHMFGKGDHTVTAPGDAAGTATPGETYKDPKDSDDKFASGGSTKMFGYEGSMPARGGITSAR
jgi:hypothetical protein